MVQTGREAVEPDQIASFVQWRESAPPSIRTDPEDFDLWMEQTGRDRAAVQHQLNHVHVRDLVSDPESVPGHASSRRDAMGSAWELQ